MEQDLEKLYKLQKLLISSESAKLLSIRKVTQDNSGKKTPGLDNKLILTPIEKFNLTKQLTLNGKSSSIKRTYIRKADGNQYPLGILTIKDRVKQMLAYLALSPQWEAQFESESYGFRSGRSVLDAIESIFIGISKKPKWVLDAHISKCFDQINHEYLLYKCNTYSEMQKQIRAWLKAGILDGENYTFPEMGTPQGGVILPLLSNIVFHGLQTRLDSYINTLFEHRSNNRQSLTFVRYANKFVVMYPDRNVLENLKKVIQEFLKPVGLKLSPTKTRIIHTLKATKEMEPGFTFLGFDIIQKPKWIDMRAAFTKPRSDQKFITLITPSKKSVKKHKYKIRDIIRRYRGVNQEKLIQKLNPIIQVWALSKRTQMSNNTFQALDQYLFTHLWKWARKRHPKMSKVKLKAKYWHINGQRSWIFGIKEKEKIIIQLQLHSKISIQRHAKVKGNASPFDGNLIYWSKRIGKNSLIPPIKARLIREQDGLCEICKNLFLPDDIIESNYIVPKALGGKNLQTNVYAVHRYCQLTKTKVKIRQIPQYRK